MLKSVIDLHANEPLKTRSLYACSIIICAGLRNIRQHCSHLQSVRLELVMPFGGNQVTSGLQGLVPRSI